MKLPHLSLTEIAGASDLPAGDPRRVHLESCVQCRALQRRYEQFTAPPAHVPAADLREAEARLAGFLAAEVLPPDAIHATARARTVRPADARGRGTWAWFGAPALAVAAGILVVSATVLVIQRAGGPGSGPSGVLRGQAGSSSEATMPTLALRTLADGRVELRWPGVPAADRYELCLYSQELRALATLSTARETVFVLSRGAAPGASAGDTLLWRVAALRGEVRLAQSNLGIVRLP